MIKPLMLSLALVGTAGFVAVGGEDYARPADSPLAFREGMSDGERATLLKAQEDDRLKRRPLELLSGVVHDVKGNPIKGAVVSAGDAEVQTDASGAYALQVPSARLTRIQVHQSGFLPKHALVTVQPFQSGVQDFWLAQRQPPVRVRADRASRVQVGPVTLDIPARAFAFEDGGGEPVGDVEVSLTPIDPRQPHGLDSAAVELRGRRMDGEVTTLRSYMMFDVALQQNGRPLQVANGREVPVTIRLDNDTPLQPGSSILMWRADAESNEWVEEDEGEVVRRSDGGLELKTSLAHFSQWNADNPVNSVSVILDGFVPPNGYDLGDVKALYVEENVSSSAWVVKTSPAIFGQSVRFGTIFPQCGQGASTFKVKVELRKPNASCSEFVYLDAKAQALASGGPSFSSSNGVFSAKNVCDYLLAYGAHQGEGTSYTSSSCTKGDCDGNLCGNSGGVAAAGVITDYGSCLQVLPNSSSSLGWSNGKDGKGLYTASNVPTPYQSFEKFQLRLVYSPTQTGKTFSTSSPDAGYLNYYNAYAANTPDVDADGVLNQKDNCPTVPNASQADTNKNGIGDQCEAACYVPANDPSAFYYDWDMDTVNDACDNLPTTWNPSQWYRY